MSSESPTAAEPVPGSNLSFKKKLIFIFGSLLFTVVIAEVALSTYSYFFYPRLVVTDPDIGWIYKPTPEPIKRHDRGGAINETFINSFGFRDSEFQLGDDVLKIMLVGDSMTFGLEADQDEIYPTLVEANLKEKLGDTKVDVMNFGLTGFNNSQEFACLKKYFPQVKPQAIVLQMSEWNDFEGNTWIYHGRYMPHTLVKDGKYVDENNPSFGYKLLNFLRDHSALYFVLTGKTEDLFTVKQTLTPQQEIDLTLHIVGEIHKYAQDNGVPFFLIYVRDPAHTTERYEAMQKFVADNGIPFHMFLATPEERVAGVGHWNGKGHREAAEALTEMLMADEAIASRAAQPEQN